MTHYALRILTFPKPSTHEVLDGPGLDASVVGSSPQADLPPPSQPVVPAVRTQGDKAPRPARRPRAPSGHVVHQDAKSVTEDLACDQNTFYEAWCWIIQRYGIYNPYTGRGAIPGLFPHGSHSVRDVLATHVLEQTGSYEEASYAIQKTQDGGAALRPVPALGRGVHRR